MIYLLVVQNSFYGQVFLVYYYFRDKNLVELHKIILFRILLPDNRSTHIRICTKKVLFRDTTQLIRNTTFRPIKPRKTDTDTLTPKIKIAKLVSMDRKK